MGTIASARRAPSLPEKPVNTQSLFSAEKTWYEIASIGPASAAVSTFVFALGPTAVSITKRNFISHRQAGDPYVFHAIIHPSFDSKALIVAHRSIWYILYVSPDETVIAIGSHCRKHAWILTTNSLRLYNRLVIESIISAIEKDGFTHLMFRYSAPQGCHKLRTAAAPH